MNNWNDEDASVEIIVDIFDMREYWLLIQPQIVAVEPVHKLHLSAVQRRLVVVVDPIDERSRGCYHDGSKWLSQVPM